MEKSIFGRAASGAVVALLTVLGLADPAAAGPVRAPLAAVQASSLESPIEDRVRAAAVVGVDQAPSPPDDHRVTRHRLELVGD